MNTYPNGSYREVVSWFHCINFSTKQIAHTDDNVLVIFVCLLQELEELLLSDVPQQLSLLSAEFQQLTNKIDATRNRMEGHNYTQLHMYMYMYFGW